MILDGQKVGILRVILKREKTTQTILFYAIKEECEKLGLKPLTRSDISRICFGDKPDRRISTYLKILMGLNAIKRRPDPYTLEEITEKEEIIESAKKS